MIVPQFLKAKKIAVMGLGITGLSICESLKKADAKLIAWDDQEEARTKAAQKEISLMNLYEADFADIDYLLWSPGIPAYYPEIHPLIVKAKAHQTVIATDIDILTLAQPQARYVCITGTNGKSTTTALIHHILEQSGLKTSCGGNLGTAALTLDPLGADGVYVLELSSYQLEMSESLQSDVSILLNITEDHLSHHGTMAEYIKAKAKLFEMTKKDGAAIIGIEKPETKAIYDQFTQSGKIKNVHALCVNQVYDGLPRMRDGWLCDELPNQEPFSSDFNEMSALRGAHNHQNALAAYIACRALGLPAFEVISHIRSFPGLKHRQQLVTKINRIEIINDSKATNPDAASKALSCYDSIFWLIGGVPKSDQSSSFDCFDPFYTKIKKAYLYGESADLFEPWLTQKLTVARFKTLDEAFLQASQDAIEAGLEGGTILLSPACASFDQFKNFEHRGDYFMDLVQQHFSGQKQVGVIYD